MVRDKTLLHRRVSPKRITLPDGRRFYTRCESVSRRNLPASVTIKRATAIGPRNKKNKNSKDQDCSI